MEKKIKVTAFCNGVKGRDRKVKPQRNDVGYIECETLEQVTDIEIEKAKSIAKVWSSHFKKVSDLRINLKPVEITKNQFGTTETYVIFSDKTIPIQ